MLRTSPLIHIIKDVFISPSSYHGRGLFTVGDRRKGEILTVLDGQVVDYLERPEVLSGEWNGLGGSKILYRHFSTSYSYINHSKNPNLTINPYDWSLCTLMDITAGEELTLDYWENGLPQNYFFS